MKALLLVDIQNDFVDGGALAVRRGREVVPVANRLIREFDLVVATQDWHPADHRSFASQQGLPIGAASDLDGLPQTAWPDHCVQGTLGAELVSELDTRGIDRVFRKGTHRDVDSYSGFFDNGRRGSTGLDSYLREMGVDSVVVVGLATDYCVKFTALDAAAAGFDTTVLLEGCRGVELSPGDVASAIEQMRAAGVHVLDKLSEYDADLAIPNVNSDNRSAIGPGAPEVVAETKYLQLVTHDDWSFVRRPNRVRVVCIVALTDDRRMVLVKQYRRPLAAEVIELPAGLAGDIAGEEGESLERAARRELLEETGYVAKRWTQLPTMASSAGLTDEVVTMFMATGLTRQSTGGGDESESIEVIELPLEEVERWLETRLCAGKFVDGRVYAGLYFAAKLRE